MIDQERKREKEEERGRNGVRERETNGNRKGGKTKISVSGE